MDRRVVARAFDEVRPAFADSVKAAFGYDLRDVQSDAAGQLVRRRIVEMQTGEGKTLTTALAAATMAAEGRHVMVATANEYLANRDAKWMAPVYGDLNRRVSSIFSGQKDAYSADVVYGTIRQFGFDFLRDGIAARDTSSGQPVFASRKRFEVLIVDEADSVLIDEARTPMVITAPASAVSDSTCALYRWAAELVNSFSPDSDYVVAASSRTLALTPDGRSRVLTSRMPHKMNGYSTTEIFHSVERALTVRDWFQRNHHYIVRENQIDLVDEYTGRASTRRTFGGGIHQAIEAKEGLELSPPTTAVARMTVQDFVGKFDHVCGLTATAREDRREFAAVYGLRICRVPTFRPVQRRSLPTKVCADQERKWQLIADEVTDVVSQGRAVLIGTRTVGHSQSLSKVLKSAGISHECLNATNPDEEAEIVANAGLTGQVTVATNMAGRGTDIPLGDSVRSKGGLHVIISELHASRRIDQQLMGRCARQGDPGTTRTFVSADDEILSLAFGADKAEEIRCKYINGKSTRWLIRQLIRAQRSMSRQHRIVRVNLAERESRLAEELTALGLDPHFDPLPEHLG